MRARSRVFAGVRNVIEWLEAPGGLRATAVLQSCLLGRVYRVECLGGAGGVYVMGPYRVNRFDLLSRSATAPPQTDQGRRRRRGR